MAQAAAMSRRRVEAVCFDLDGVLVDSMPLHASAWQAALAPLGLTVSRRWIYELEGESGAVTARTLLRRRAPAPSAGAIASLLASKERQFNRLAEGLRLNERLVGLITRLARRGLPLGLVTGTSSREVRRFVPRPVLRLFGVVVTGDRVAHGKPHPEPYRRAFRALEVTPARGAVVENAPYGIRSARSARAGLVIALASSLPRRFLSQADLIAGSPSQLCRMLDDLTSTH